MFHKRFSKFITFTLAIVMSVSTGITVNAAVPADGATDADIFASENNLQEDWEEWKSKWDTVKDNWEYISVTPGSNESEINFAWYGKTSSVLFEVSRNADMSNPVFSETISGDADDSIKKAIYSIMHLNQMLKGFQKAGIITEPAAEKYSARR